MTEIRTQIHRFKARPQRFADCRAGVSLHSHTMHSQEYLTRLPTYIAKFPVGSYILEREIGRLHLYIEERAGLKALVSITDHDNIEARQHLQLLEKMRWVIGLVANPMVRPALRLPFLGYEEGGL